MPVGNQSAHLYAERLQGAGDVLGAGERPHQLRWKRSAKGKRKYRERLESRDATRFGDGIVDDSTRFVKALQEAYGNVLGIQPDTVSALVVGVPSQRITFRNKATIALPSQKRG